MAPRSSWKGFIKLSLVSVPVKAYTANQTSAEVRLNQLHGECNNRVKYQKVCPEHGEIANDEIVSGYEYAKGQYVIVDLEELDKLRTKSDRSVNIRGFVDADEVSALYHAGRTYYLLPEGAVGQKPYQLLMQSMLDANVHAVAQVVLSGKEQMVLVRPVDDVLAMVVLSYANRVKLPESFKDEVVAQELSKEELQLTRTLIDASRIEDFEYDGFKDVYTEKLTQLIQAKVDGEEIVAVPDPEEPKILNLMEALKKSVAEAQLGGGESTDGKKKKASSKKMAPSASRRGGTKKKSG